MEDSHIIMVVWNNYHQDLGEITTKILVNFDDINLCYVAFCSLYRNFLDSISSVCSA
jgi:transcriptional regulator NrdR family protein